MRNLHLNYYYCLKYFFKITWPLGSFGGPQRTGKGLCVVGLYFVRYMHSPGVMGPSVITTIVSPMTHHASSVFRLNCHLSGMYGIEIGIFK